VPHASVAFALVEQPTQLTQVRADDQGRFSTPPVAQGQVLRLRADCPAGMSDWVTASAGQADVQLQLSQAPRGSIVGMLVDPGHNVEERAVLASDTGSNNPNDKPQAVATSNPGGRFEFPSLLPGTYTLWVQRTDAGKNSGWVSQRASVEPLKVTSVVVDLGAAAAGAPQ
jgi:hypothetical protein